MNNTKKRAFILSTIFLSSLQFINIQNDQIIDNQSYTTHQVESFYSDGSTLVKNNNKDNIKKSYTDVIVEKESFPKQLLTNDNIKNIDVFINKDKVRAFQYNRCTTEKTYYDFNIFDKVKLVGRNKKYAKIKKNDKFYYINNDDITENRDDIFTNIDKQTRFINKNTKLYPSVKTLKSNNDGVNIKKNTKIYYIGNNNKGISKILYNNMHYFIKDEFLNTKPIVINKQNNKRKTQSKKYKQNNTNNNKNNKSTNNNYKKIKQNTHTSNNNTIPCNFSAYYPANTALQGGLYDALGNRLNPNNNTCAAPSNVPFGTKILVQGTGTHIDGQVFTVTDRGGAINMQADGTWRVDILMHNKNQAYSFGRRNGTITIVN